MDICIFVTQLLQESQLTLEVPEPLPVLTAEIQQEFVDILDFADNMLFKCPGKVIEICLGGFVCLQVVMTDLEGESDPDADDIDNATADDKQLFPVEVHEFPVMCCAESVGRRGNGKRKLMYNAFV